MDVEEDCGKDVDVVDKFCPLEDNDTDDDDGGGGGVENEDDDDDNTTDDDPLNACNVPEELVSLCVVFPESPCGACNGPSASKSPRNRFKSS
jgi:hypothetical protein